MTASIDTPGTSTRPYLLRALHEWCTDNGFTPYLAVYVDNLVQVPMEHVKNNEIVLNVGFEATSGLSLGNEAVEFRARFGGVSRDIRVPVDHVVAIYARENGQGMAFPVPTPGANLVGVAAPSAAEPVGLQAVKSGKAPRLTRVPDSAEAVDAPSTKDSENADPVKAADDAPTDPKPPNPPAPSGSSAGSAAPAKGRRPALKRIK